jgi:hypothetical protein
VAEVMVFVLWLIGYVDEYQNNDIGDKVRQGVNGISYHCRTMSYDAGKEFESEQQ